MTTDPHITVFMGAGVRCTRCNAAWDIDDEAPETCVAEPADSSFLNGGPAVEPAPRPLPRLVAFAGKKFSGKDTAAKALISEGYTAIAFADGIKVMLRALLEFRGCPAAEIDRMLDGDLKETPSRYLSGHTPRHAMQSLGTGWGRDSMSQDFWVETTADRLADAFERVVITDVRRQNEADFVFHEGGEVYRINRPGLRIPADEHISERLVGTLRVTADLVNDAPSAEAFSACVKKQLIGDSAP